MALDGLLGPYSPPLELLRAPYGAQGSQEPWVSNWLPKDARSRPLRAHFDKSKSKDVIKPFIGLRFPDSESHGGPVAALASAALAHVSFKGIFLGFLLVQF